MVLILEDIQIGWICALIIEASVARLMLDHVYNETIPLPRHDDNIYTYGRINLKTGDGFHNIAISQLPLAETGKASAATVAKDMRRTFPNIKFGLMVGIAGGIWSRDIDVRLGDVVVGVSDDNGSGVIQYDHGKYLQDSAFVQRGVMNKAPKLLRTAVGIVQRNHMCKIRDYVTSLNSPKIRRFAHRPAHDYLFEPRYTHKVKGRSCRYCASDRLRNRPKRSFTYPAIHYGPIASGDAVIKDALFAQAIQEKHGVLCFEMEAAGLDAFPCLVIRGISDYADTHKNDDWHPYAAAAAAAYAKEVLAVVPSTAVAQLPSIAIRSKNLHTGPAYMASLREQEQVRQMRASQRPKPTSKNLHTGPAYMASLREQEQLRQMRASQKPKPTSKNLHTGPAYIASLREQEQTRQYRESKKRGRGGGCTVM
ncbi:purine and uridine phosphorylase [Aureobasidium pullulans]|uniref:Purine and uridine phosphorylase n=1 Tax=Aureobasidium pullulans TaxID=5580 RepID=A0A4S9TAD7_AURPU|nr:purine and uridine phosphorylase [Aureobasidium pullulans]THZ76572.1 purine and uridine phosphorylase [Aureobasidium pullulans]THZ94492.1 purine and uridine phosphorylase [Aureobasidium pullulans]